MAQIMLNLNVDLAASYTAFASNLFRIGTEETQLLELTSHRITVSCLR